jgi:hypothetical protein
MAALSLLESSKQLPEGRAKEVIKLYATSYQPLEVLPFMQADPGGVLSWVTESSLGSSAGRAIGSDFTASNGTFQPHTAVAAIKGGKVQVDRAIRITNPSIVPTMKENKIRGFAKDWTKAMFEGLGGTDIRGLSQWILGETGYTGQTVAVNAAISMSVMDQAYDKLNVIPGRSFFYMSQYAFRVLNTLSRTNGAGQQNIVWGEDKFGSRTPFYSGVPIVVLKDGTGADVLSITESGTAHTGGSTSSVWGVTYAPDMVTGFQSAPMSVIDFKDDTNYENYTIEHIASVAPKQPRSVVRLTGIAQS